MMSRHSRPFVASRYAEISVYVYIIYIYVYIHIYIHVHMHICIGRYVCMYL